jgi:uncharacterized protein
MTTQVVTNAGPLVTFAKLNALHLFKDLYDTILIPQAVYQEAVIQGKQYGFQHAQRLSIFLQQQQWPAIQVERLSEDIETAKLDRGEKEAIALALSRAALLLIDEERGRDVARQQRIPVRGSLGVLIDAYRQHLLSADLLKLHIAEIRQRSDIWISPTLCDKVLQELHL